MQFRLLERGEIFPKNAKELVCLTIDRWNDYSYITMFYMTVFDKEGQMHNIGNVKIGFAQQTIEDYTYKAIQELFKSNTFTKLPEDFFLLVKMLIFM